MKFKIKNMLALLLCIALVFTVAACGEKSTSDTPASTTAAADEPAASSTAAPDNGDAAAPDEGADPGAEPGTASSAPAAPADEPSVRDTLNVAISGDSGTLNYIKMMGGFQSVARQVAEPLFENDANMNKVWLLATGIDEVSMDKWVIHLREGVTFSNGNPFNADDVMFTLNYLKNDPMGFMYIPTFDLENSKIIDDYTIEIAIVGYQITQIDALNSLYLLDAESFNEDEYALNPIGTGPYIITDYVINSHVNLIANENYWGGAPKIKNLNFKVLNEDTQRVNALEAGAVDVSAVAISDIDYISTNPDFEIKTVMSGLCNNVVFNVSDQSIFHDVNARIAASLAIDREAIVSLVYQNHALVTNYPVSMAARDYEDRFANLHDTYARSHDLELAKEYAAAAGIEGAVVKAITNGSSEYITIAEIIQANLKEIGVIVEINNYDAASYYDASNDPSLYDMSIYATASPQKLVVGMLYSYVLYTPVLMNNDWEGKERFLSLGVELLANPDEAARSDDLFELVQIFENAVLWYGLCDTETAFAVNKNLAGVEFNSVGGFCYGNWTWIG